MSYGIVVRDAVGRVILDTNQRMARLLDTIETGRSAGARSYAVGGGQLGLAVCAPLNVFYNGPAIYLSGNTISWDFSTNPTTGYSVKILVWVY
ncbi:hypothetical protein LMG26788_02187 [Achromobacter pulmonis]|uniref:Uncharacterized protein n=1 Tax=Achromobacter pulmonis TaxID=1389932 RepID=A0A6S7CS04_9BURK|nr:hypothetical protein [Achromobacter pulmonis]CAB3859502.1 hypothetical protein LMG26788_02187 [Achromobacter pulmonis]